jgi:hypothetical protein
MGAKARETYPTRSEASTKCACQMRIRPPTCTRGARNGLGGRHSDPVGRFHAIALRPKWAWIRIRPRAVWRLGDGRVMMRVRPLAHSLRPFWWALARFHRPRLCSDNPGPRGANGHGCPDALHPRRIPRARAQRRVQERVPGRPHRRHDGRDRRAQHHHRQRPRRASRASARYGRPAVHGRHAGADRRRAPVRISRRRRGVRRAALPGRRAGYAASTRR